jgi:hypothetical protein
VLGIDAQADGDLDGLIELRECGRLDELDRCPGLIPGIDVPLFGGGFELLSVLFP